MMETKLADINATMSASEYATCNAHQQKHMSRCVLISLSRRVKAIKGENNNNYNKVVKCCVCFVLCLLNTSNNKRNNTAVIAKGCKRAVALRNMFE